MPSTLVAFAVARDLLSLSVPASPAVQESVALVLTDRRKHVATSYCLVLEPLVPSKVKRVMLA